MRDIFRHLIRAVAAVLAVSSVIFAQIPAPSGAAKTPPDLSGVWAAMRADEGNFRFNLEDPPLQPWANEIYKRNRAGLTNPRDQGLDELDPNTFCFPPGPSRAMLAYPFEIIQLPAKIVMLFEVSNGVRQIFLDGRGHPQGWPFGYMGHSVGKWDRDTLVVDTAGFNDKTWVDRGGVPHSDALRVVERFRRVKPDTLEVEFLFDDPKAFTKPWGAKKVYQLRPKQDILEYIVCEEHLQIGKYREVTWPPEPSK